MSKFTKKLREFIVTGFFTGYIPIVPGIVASLLGAVIYVYLSPIPLVYYPFIAIMIAVSIPLADYAEKHIFKEKDSPHIVLDEIVGFMLAMVSFTYDGSLESLKFLIIGLILYNLFNLWKPYPMKHTTKVEGGLGIVLDDVLAAVYTNLFLQFLRIIDNYIRF